MTLWLLAQFLDQGIDSLQKKSCWDGHVEHLKCGRLLFSDEQRVHLWMHFLAKHLRVWFKEDYMSCGSHRPWSLQKLILNSMPFPVILTSNQQKAQQEKTDDVPFGTRRSDAPFHISSGFDKHDKLVIYGKRNLLNSDKKHQIPSPTLNKNWHNYKTLRLKVFNAPLKPLKLPRGHNCRHKPEKLTRLNS